MLISYQESLCREYTKSMDCKRFTHAKFLQRLIPNMGWCDPAIALVFFLGASLVSLFGFGLMDLPWVDFSFRFYLSCFRLVLNRNKFHTASFSCFAHFHFVRSLLPSGRWTDRIAQSSSIYKKGGKVEDKDSPEKVDMTPSLCD